MSVDRRTHSASPPAVKRHTKRAVIVIGCGVVIAILLIVVVLNLDTSPDETLASDTNPDVIELIPPPAQLSPKQLAGGTDLGGQGDTFPAELPQGGWIQMPDAQGRIAQRYRFNRSHPNPEGKPAGWIRLEQPEAHVFFSDDQAVTLRADEALAYAPARALEEGTMKGSVVIEVYKLNQNRTIDPLVDKPSVVIHTPEATFDNQLGQVRCPGFIKLDAPGKAELVGENLTLDINNVAQRLESLELAKVQYVKLINPPDAEEQSSAIRNRSDEFQFDRSAVLQVRSQTIDESESAEQFYDLTLTKNIIIRQGPAAQMKVARGDALSIVFSPKTQGLGDALAGASFINLLPLGEGRVRVSPPPHDTQPMTFQTFLAACVIAQTSSTTKAVQVPIPGEDETIITVDGPLRIRPIDDPAEKLESIEDSRFLMTGSPVTLDDEFENAHATAGRLLYHSLSRKVELVATDDYPATIDSPQLKAGGKRFWLAQDDGKAGFDGAGWLRPQGGASSPTINSFQDSNNDGSAVPPVEIAAPDDDVAELITELDVRWEGSVELEFTPGSEEGSLGSIKRATFLKQVRVKSKDGDIDCEYLDLTVRADKNGKPAPHTMTARDNVRVADPDRAMWADILIVSFMDSPDDDEANSAASDDMFGQGSSTIRELTAEGNVQVRLADGSRAFAQKIVGDGIAGTLRLQDDVVTIAAGRLFMEQLGEIIIRQEDESAFGPHAGRLLIFNRPLDTGANGRIERPVINNDENPPVVEAEWNSSMLYDHAFNNGAGSVDLQGKVKAESSRTPLEYNTMQGERVTMEMAFVEESNITAKPRAADDDKGSEDAINMDDRRLSRFIAHGDAKLESRTWREGDEARAEKPRIFYAAGEHIEYNDITFEARIPGKGTLLLRDEWPDQNAPSTNDPGATFSGKGTTQFKWRNDLHMQREIDNRYKINMTGEVTILHEGLDKSIATMTCEDLEALVSRVNTERDRETGLDFGGAMDLHKISGKGAVLVKTDARTVECDTFEYNVETQLARASAQPGRMITIITQGTAYPLQAREVLWDMARDSITIIQGAGTATP